MQQLCQEGHPTQKQKTLRQTKHANQFAVTTAKTICFCTYTPPCSRSPPPRSVAVAGKRRGDGGCVQCEFTWEGVRSHAVTVPEEQREKECGLMSFLSPVMIPHLSWEMAASFLWKRKRPTHPFRINGPVSQWQTVHVLLGSSSSIVHYCRSCRYPSLPLYFTLSGFHVLQSFYVSVLRLQLLSRRRTTERQKQKGDGECRMKRGTGENWSGARRIEIKVMINEALSSWMWDSVVGQSFAGLLLGKRFMLSAVY